MHRQLWEEGFHLANNWRATLNAETRWPVHRAVHDQGTNQMAAVWNLEEHPGKQNHLILSEPRRATAEGEWRERKDNLISLLNTAVVTVYDMTKLFHDVLDTTKQKAEKNAVYSCMYPIFLPMCTFSQSQFSITFQGTGCEWRPTQTLKTRIQESKLWINNWVIKGRRVLLPTERRMPWSFHTLCATLSSTASVSLTISFLACATVSAVCGLVSTRL